MLLIYCFKRTGLCSLCLSPGGVAVPGACAAAELLRGWSLCRARRSRSCGLCCLPAHALSWWKDMAAVFLSAARLLGRGILLSAAWGRGWAKGGCPKSDEPGWVCGHEHGWWWHCLGHQGPRPPSALESWQSNRNSAVGGGSLLSFQHNWFIKINQQWFALLLA